MNLSHSRSWDLIQALNWVCGKHWGIRSLPGKATPLLRQNDKGQGMRGSFWRIGQEWNYTFNICNSTVWRWKWVEKQKGKTAPPWVNLALVPIKSKSVAFYRESFIWFLCFRYHFLLSLNQQGSSSCTLPLGKLEHSSLTYVEVLVDCMALNKSYSECCLRNTLSRDLNPKVIIPCIPPTLVFSGFSLSSFHHWSRE